MVLLREVARPSALDAFGKVAPLAQNGVTLADCLVRVGLQDYHLH